MDRSAELLRQSGRRSCRATDRAGRGSHRTILVGVCCRRRYHTLRGRILGLPNWPTSAVAVARGNPGHERSINAAGNFSYLDRAFGILIDGFKETKSSLKSENFFAELKRRNVWGAHAPPRAGCGALAATRFSTMISAKRNSKFAMPRAASPAGEAPALPGKPACHA